MLKAENLSLQRAGKNIISHIDLVVPAGQVMGILGTNGAGKSTLLAGISGDLAPFTGQVLLADKPLAEWQAEQKARLLALLPQNSTLNFGFLVKEIVALGRLPYNTGFIKDQQIVQDVLALTDVSYLAERNYLTLSGGERQRVHLARILAQLWPVTEQSVLLLDEPTSMLDPLHQHTLLKVVRHCAKEGAAVLVILHDLNLAAAYCDQLALLKAGSIFNQGSPAEVLTTAHIKEVFGLDVLIESHPLQGYPLVIPR